MHTDNDYKGKVEENENDFSDFYNTNYDEEEKKEDKEPKK